MPLSDIDLMLSFQGGKVSAFTALVKRHQTGVLNYFYRMTWNRELAEDLTQEVFLKVYRSVEKYQPSAKFTTFLYRIARNHWIDWCRTKGKEPSAVSLSAPMAGFEGATLCDTIAHGQETPVRELERRETHAAIMQALNELTDDHRQVFVMSELQGLRYADIAEVLEIPVGTVKSRMHHAVKRLRLRLAALMGGSS